MNSLRRRRHSNWNIVFFTFFLVLLHLKIYLTSKLTLGKCIKMLLKFENVGKVSKVLKNAVARTFFHVRADYHATPVENRALPPGKLPPVKLL